MNEYRCHVDFDEVLKRFEKQMFVGEWEFELPSSALDFELFQRDIDNIYSLMYNLEEQTFSITLVTFEKNDGDYDETIYLETYPMELYNRDFLKGRIIHYLNRTIENEMKMRKVYGKGMFNSGKN